MIVFNRFMQFIWVGALCLISISISAQDSFNLLDFDANNVPADIQAKLKGNLVDGRYWKDENGENYMILSRTDTKIEKEGEKELKTAYLYAVHYLKEDANTYLEVRKVMDFVEKCDQSSMVVEPVEESLFVTDLDENGIAEISFLYHLSCGGDPMEGVPTKLVLLEDGEKYPMKGNASLWAARNGGSGEAGGVPPMMGAEFDDAPDAFRKHAQELWAKYATFKPE